MMYPALINLISQGNDWLGNPAKHFLPSTLACLVWPWAEPSESSFQEKTWLASSPAPQVEPSENAISTAEETVG
jgi:hypothetical protein